MTTTFVAYLVVLIIIGYLAYRCRSQEADDYFVSHRDHGTWVSALSASASSESGWVMLGLVGAAYTSGISSLWLLPGCFAGYLFNWLVIGPRLYKLSVEHDAYSIADVMAARFASASTPMKHAIRATIVLLIVVFMGVYVAAQFIATGKAVQAMFGWHHALGVGLGMGIVILYTAFGGLRAISWTDVLQAVLMLTALVTLPIMLVLAGTHTNGLLESLRATDPALLDWWGNHTGMGAIGFVIGWAGIGLGYPGQPHVLKRFLSARSPGVFRAAPWIALIWSQAVFLGAIALGLAARITYPNLADPEQALPIAAVDMLPPVIAGLALAAVFSAICSTADSQLLEAAGAIAHDTIYGSRNGHQLNSSSNARKTVLARTVVVIVGLGAGLFAMGNTGVIFTLVLYSWAALGSSLGTTLSVALLWKRMTPFGALCGLITGPATVIVWRSVLGWDTHLYELVPASVLSILAIVFGSLLTTKTSSTSLD